MLLIYYSGCKANNIINIINFSIWDFNQSETLKILAMEWNSQWGAELSFSASLTYQNFFFILQVTIHQLSVCWELDLFIVCH